jgi:hypothetical protein
MNPHETLILARFNLRICQMGLALARSQHLSGGLSVPAFVLREIEAAVGCAIDLVWEAQLAVAVTSAGEA